VKSVANANKAGDRRQRTEACPEPAEGTDDRIGKPGNQGNRVQVIRITGNQAKSPQMP